MHQKHCEIELKEADTAMVSKRINLKKKNATFKMLKLLLIFF